MKRLWFPIALALSSQLLTGCAAEPVVAALTAARPGAPAPAAPAPSDPTAVAPEGATLGGDARD